MSVDKMKEYIAEGVKTLEEAPVGKAFELWSTALDEDLSELESILDGLNVSLAGLSESVIGAIDTGRTIARAGRNTKQAFQSAIGAEEVPNILQGAVGDAEEITQLGTHASSLGIFMDKSTRGMQGAVKSMIDMMDTLRGYVEEGKKQASRTAVVQADAHLKATNYLEQLEE
jgi:hypothetical protein